jgi:hypothetical protein
MKFRPVTILKVSERCERRCQPLLLVEFDGRRKEETDFAIGRQVVNPILKRAELGHQVASHVLKVRFCPKPILCAGADPKLTISMLMKLSEVGVRTTATDMSGSV